VQPYAAKLRSSSPTQTNSRSLGTLWFCSFLLCLLIRGRWPGFDFGSEGWGFESLRARSLFQRDSQSAALTKTRLTAILTASRLDPQHRSSARGAHPAPCCGLGRVRTRSEPRRAARLAWLVLVIMIDTALPGAVIALAPAPPAPPSPDDQARLRVLSPGSDLAPHEGQTSSRRAPQWTQNLRPARFSCPERAEHLWRLLGGQPLSEAIIL
jgi:hypothetical protein